jgi:hypothetical protein
MPVEPNFEPFKLHGPTGWLDELGGMPVEPDLNERLTTLLSFMNDAVECLKESPWKAQEVRILTYLLCANAQLNHALVARLAKLTPG